MGCSKSRLLLSASIALVTLAACSNTNISDLQQRPPREIYKTAKNPDQLATCLIETLGRLGAPNTYRRDDGATVVHFTIENNTSATFVITSGQVEVRTISKIVPFRKRTEACL